MVSRNWSQVKGHLGQGHKIFRVRVKLIDSRVLKVSWRSVAFYASYSRKTEGGVRPPPPIRPTVNVVAPCVGQSRQSGRHCPQGCHVLTWRGIYTDDSTVALEVRSYFLADATLNVISTLDGLFPHCEDSQTCPNSMFFINSV